MNRHNKELTIKNYFNMWLTQNFDNLENIFEVDIYYSECYGPEYYGLVEIKQWIKRMLEIQKVLEWTIKQFIHEDNIVVVEWYFKDINTGKENEFAGVSIIEFNDNKIKSIKEFESKLKGGV